MFEKKVTNTSQEPTQLDNPLFLSPTKTRTGGYYSKAIDNTCHKSDEESELICIDSPAVKSILRLNPISHTKIRSIRSHGVIIDVLGDGNCGYRAVIQGLVDLKKIDSNNIPSMTEFRKLLWNELQANKLFLWKWKHTTLCYK